MRVANAKSIRPRPGLALARVAVLAALTAGGAAALAAPPSATPAAPASTPPAAPTADLDAYLAPAERIDIGDGRHLNLRCSGQGAPTVLLEAGFAADSLAWAKAQRPIAERNRVCAYDRAGHGFSDPGPLPRDLDADVADLHALIRAADLDTPLILVGHSYGSQVVRRYDLRHPRRVAALVLVDPPEQNLAAFSPSYAKTEAELAPKMLAMYRACAQGAREGRLPATDGALKSCLRGPDPGYSEALNAAVRRWRSQPAFWDSIVSASEHRAALYAGPVPASERHDGKPVIVLSAGRAGAAATEADRKALAAAREQTHQALMASSRQGRRVSLDDSGHDIPNDQPEAIAIAVFEAMQMRARPDRP